MNKMSKTMVMGMTTPVRGAQRAVFTQRQFGRPSVSLRPVTRPPRARVAANPVVALFGFGAKADPDATYICVDCGYIYTGPDFTQEPRSYQCPACSSKKNRFKVFKGNAGRRPNNSNSACLTRLKEKEW